MANEIIEGILEAIRLIFTFDPEVWGVIAVSFRVSLTSTFLAALVALPLGSYIGLREFRGTKGVVKPNEFQVVHTSPAPLETFSKTFKAGKGTSETPGIATSPYGKAVPQFLGLEPDLSASYRFTLFPKLKRPTVSTSLRIPE